MSHEVVPVRLEQSLSAQHAVLPVVAVKQVPDEVDVEQHAALPVHPEAGVPPLAG